MRRIDQARALLLDAAQVRKAFLGKGGSDLAEKLIQGFIKDRVFEDLKDVPVKIQAHELSDGKGHGQVKGVALHKAEAALLAIFFRIEGEPCFLDGGKISPDGAGVAVFLLGELGHSGPMVSGLDGPQNAPLSGQLLTPHVILTFRLGWVRIKSGISLEKVDYCCYHKDAPK